MRLRIGKREKKNPIIVSLDGLGRIEALNLAEMLSGRVWGFKAHSLIDRCGTPVIQVLKQYGNVFTDPKLHDIPSVVGERIKIYADAGADFITVHAQGGPEMMEQAARAAGESKVLAVTMLTSFDEGRCLEFFGLSINQKVLQLAIYAKEAGCAGVVSSGQELPVLTRKENGVSDLLRIVPSIRPKWYKTTDDQKRTLTPKEAMKQGANLLVIGRPLVAAPDPLKALKKILKEISPR